MNKQVFSFGNKNRVWYSPKSDLKSPDTTHQILMFGNLEDIRLLKKTVGETTIKNTFLRFPKKVYTGAALNFIKKFILRLPTPIDDQQYLKTTPRITR